LWSMREQLPESRMNAKTRRCGSERSFGRIEVMMYKFISTYQ
jgi:hypothetical protein